jgi:hypothetical protein
MATSNIPCYMRHRHLTPHLPIVVTFLLFAGVFLTLSASTHQLLAKKSRQDPYPPPEQIEESYPGTNSETLIMPPVSDDLPATQPETNLNTQQAIGIQSQGNTTRGLVFLWLGFMATFFLFLAGILGSILLFTRQNDTS